MYCISKFCQQLVTFFWYNYVRKVPSAWLCIIACNGQFYVSVWVSYGAQLLIKHHSKCCWEGIFWMWFTFRLWVKQISLHNVDGLILSVEGSKRLKFSKEGIWPPDCLLTQDCHINSSQNFQPALLLWKFLICQPHNRTHRFLKITFYLYVYVCMYVCVCVLLVLFVWRTPRQI